MKSRTKGLLMLFCIPLSIILWQVHIGDYVSALAFAIFTFAVCWLGTAFYLLIFGPGDSNAKSK